MGHSEVTVLSLCSGIGGLDLGVGLAEPGGCRVLGYIEREAFAASVLLARMEEQNLEPAPVWCADLRDFDGGPWRGSVDLVIGGFPCQPASVAGKKLGEDDERWIWPEIARILGEVRPELVLLENVPGLLSLKPPGRVRDPDGGRGVGLDAENPVRRWGFGSVLGDLAELGYDAEWGLFSAAETGAPHLRKRLFVLARRVRDSDGQPLRNEQGRKGRPNRGGAPESRDVGSERLADPQGRGAPAAQQPGRTRIAGRRGAGMADRHGRRLPGERPLDDGDRGEARGHDPGRRSERVVDPESNGRGQGRSEPGLRIRGGSPLAGPGGPVADTEDDRRQWPGQPRRGGTRPEDGSERLADTGGVGRGGRPEEAGRKEGERTQGRAGLADPPGPRLEGTGLAGPHEGWEGPVDGRGDVVDPDGQRQQERRTALPAGEAGAGRDERAGAELPSEELAHADDEVRGGVADTQVRGKVRGAPPGRGGEELAHASDEPTGPEQEQQLGERPCVPRGGERALVDPEGELQCDEQEGARAVRGGGIDQQTRSRAAGEEGVADAQGLLRGEEQRVEPHGVLPPVEGTRERVLDRLRGMPFPPGPGGDWARIPKELWPAVESTVRFLAPRVPAGVDGDMAEPVQSCGRVDQLRALGNAVVPKQAAIAYLELGEREPLE